MSPKSHNSFIKQGKSYFLAELQVFIISIILSLFAAFLVVVPPWLIGLITSEIAKDNGSIEKIKVIFSLEFTLVQLIIIIIILYIIAYLFYFLVSQILLNTTQKITLKIREDVIQKINEVPPSYFQENPVGDVLTKMTNLVETINNALLQNTNQVIRAITLIVAITLVMFFINPLLAGITTFFFIINLVISFTLMKKSYPDFITQTKAYGELNGHLEDIYTKQLAIRLYDYRQTSDAYFNSVNEKLHISSNQSIFKSSLMRPLEYLFKNISYILVILVGFLLVKNNGLLIGVIVSFVLYTKQISSPNEQLTNGFNALQSSYAALIRIINFLNSKSEVSTGVLNLEKVNNIIDFQNVCVNYDENIALQDINIKIKVGETIALVGATGSGKSTLAKLLMRFVEPSMGSVSFDGENINEYTSSSIRDYITYLPQDAFVFNGSIMDNILYGNPNKTRIDAIEAVKKCQLEEFIKSFPGSYDFIIKEDKTKLSLGEKQLIAIIRAKLSNKPIFILDEGTSAIDSNTENLVLVAIKEMIKMKTSILILSNISKVQDIDRIYLLEKGQLVDFGTKEELALNHPKHEILLI